MFIFLLNIYHKFLIYRNLKIIKEIKIYNNKEKIVKEKYSLFDFN
jgi:hypothetical protein